MWVETIELIPPSFVDASSVLNLEFEKTPDLFMLFGNTDTIIVSKCLKRLENDFKDTLIVGCSTGTTIFGKKLCEENISGAAVGFENTKVRHAFGQIDDSSQSGELGENLARQLIADDLVGVILFCDGLLINGSTIIDGMVKILGVDIPISGGLAGDGERFEQTRIFLGSKVIEKGAIAIGLYSNKLVITHGVFGGWYEFGPEWEITKSIDNIVSEIEDMPAIELYDDYVGTDRMALQASALLYPLKVWPPNQPEKGVVRAIMNVDRENGQLVFAGDVPQGWHARLMHGNQRGMIDGATMAANLAFDRMKEINQAFEPDFCFIVSCVARRILLGSRSNSEIDAISNTIGMQTPICGFYSYGEIAPQMDSPQTGLHNQTMTLTLMKELV